MKTDCAAFLHFCRTQLKHEQPAARPPLSAILAQPYLNHDFITVHSFLTELPLKSATEKLHFFTHLADRLRRFDEHTVGAHLGELLLGRLVLTDATAQLHVVPLLLAARSEPGTDDDTIDQLFGVATFQRFVVPRLVQLFAVHEAQTRHILLEYFGGYVRRIGDGDLRELVLPQLLLGIKDTDDELVAATLRALAELVPLLGASTVIGRNRRQIFTDGRPAQHQTTTTTAATMSEVRNGRSEANGTTATAQADLSAVPVDWMEHRSITPVLMTSHHHDDGGHSGNGSTLTIPAANHNSYQQQQPHLQLHHHQQQQQHHMVDLSESGSQADGVLMPERLSPDGGEDEKTTSDAPDLETDAWSDWEADEEVAPSRSRRESCVIEEEPSAKPTTSAAATAVPMKLTKKSDTTTKADTPPEIDYFADMVPVIEKSSVVHIAEPSEEGTAFGTAVAERAEAPSSRLNVADETELEAGGWGDDADEWADG